MILILGFIISIIFSYFSVCSQNKRLIPTINVSLNTIFHAKYSVLKIDWYIEYFIVLYSILIVFDW